MKPGISAIVIAYNQRELLQKCLASLTGWVNEIVVVDLQSTEDIASVAKKYHAVYKKIPRVEVVEQIRQKTTSFAKHEFILFLDPDEEIPKSLSIEFAKIAQSGIADYVSTPRKNVVFGKWLEASRWWPDYQVRFFRHDAVTWPTILHAQPQLSGRELRLPPQVKTAIMHQNYISLDEWFEKNRRYAKTDALARIISKLPFTLTDAMGLSISELVSRFFAGKGYKDGLHGLMLGILQSFYYFLVYAYYWESKKFASLESAQTVRAFPRSWFSHGLSEIMHWDTGKTTFVKKIKTKLVRRMLS